MDQQKKKRSENWSAEEKDILREMIAQSRHIIEDKSTKASSNIKKAQEWKNIAKKINELTGKNRSDGEVKLAWKRMKLAAKANLSAHRQHQMKTGGGEKPKSPSQEDLAIMNIAPHDFLVEYTDYDSDAIKNVVELNPSQDSATTASATTAGPSIITLESPPEVLEVIMDQGTSKVNVLTTTGTSSPPRNNENIRRKQSGKKGPQSM
ncbi:unnamed protein product [Euphydryas editha]|uniref:Regulatory protein zeste n=1 Tax=Euphydryas editha TaxID=104508 RepID=A0AAU9UDQ3_EUPED|nr:unnamed protein product [Euphydryas editha]